MIALFFLVLLLLKNGVGGECGIIWFFTVCIGMENLQLLISEFLEVLRVCFVENTCSYSMVWYVCVNGIYWNIVYLTIAASEKKMT